VVHLKRLQNYNTNPTHNEKINKYLPNTLNRHVFNSHNKPQYLHIIRTTCEKQTNFFTPVIKLTAEMLDNYTGH
jgi:hypothetical protein